MAYMRVTINDEVVLDGDTGQWEERPPAFIQEQVNKALTSGAPPSPWMRALMLVLAEAAMTQTFTSVDVKHWGSGWTLTTKYAVELEQ